MAVTTFVTNKLKNMLAGGLVSGRSAISCYAVPYANFTPGDATNFLSDIAAAAAGNGLTAQALTLTATRDDTNDRTTLSSAAITFGPASGAVTDARCIVFYNYTGTPSTSEVLLVVTLDSAAVAVSQAGSITLTPNAAGWAYVG